MSLPLKLWSLIAVWLEVEIGSSQIFPKICQKHSSTIYYVKKEGFQNYHKSCQIFWIILKKHKAEMSRKIAQSCHTGCLHFAVKYNQLSTPKISFSGRQECLARLYRYDLGDLLAQDHLKLGLLGLANTRDKNPVLRSNVWASAFAPPSSNSEFFFTKNFRLWKNWINFYFRPSGWIDGGGR